MPGPAMPEDPAADAAAEELYGAPLRAFAAERKRLAAGLKASGDAAAARRVAALPRPTLPAWVVNQLWRAAQDEVVSLFAAGSRMRAGDAGAWDEQRAILQGLAARAAEVLASDRHAASPATLRRVTSTLQSLSAAGGFAPDRPGQVAVDRDPPGFEVLGGELPPPPERPARKAARGGGGKTPPPGKPARPTKQDRLAREAAERARARAARATRRADVLDEEVRDLRAEVARAEKALARVRGALADKEAALAKARAEADES
ncbi:MAG TPA: hypothetical protein VMZ28_14465 [Kofleriaceae bacterium]|nr:hypothetical protein [Kofleriaceae bacterium]